MLYWDVLVWVVMLTLLSSAFGAFGVDAPPKAHDGEIRCSYTTYKQIEKDFAELWPIPATAVECAYMKEIENDFLILRSAAGLAVDDLHALKQTGASEDIFRAWYNLEGKSVDYSWQAIRVLGKNKSQRLIVTAHEIGHALQHRDGMPFAKPPSDDDKANLIWSRKIEAHADMLGRQIIERAGLSGELAVRGIEQTFGCGQIIETPPERKNWSHPTPQVRWLNQKVLENKRLTQADEAGSVFDGNLKRGGSENVALVPATPMKRALKVDDFDENGLLKPRVWLDGLKVHVPPPGMAPEEGNQSSKIMQALEAAATRVLGNEGLVSQLV